MRLLVIKILLSALFLCSGIIKLLNIEEFYNSVESFKIITNPTLIEYIGNTITLLEITVAIGIWVKPKPIFIIIALLSCLFCIVFTHSLIYGINPDCGCLGKYFKTTPLEGIIRAIIILLITLKGYILNKKLDNSQKRTKI